MRSLFEAAQVFCLPLPTRLQPDSPPTPDGRQGNGREVLLISERQAVLDALLKVGDGIGPTPGGAVAADHILSWEVMPWTNSSYV